MSVAKSRAAPEYIPAAGLSLEAQPERPDGVPLKKGEFSIASRALALSTYFFSGALCINLSQILGTPLYLVNEDWYNAWIAFTKQSFGLLTMTLTQAFSPTKVIVSGDKSVRGQLLQSTDGNLILDFPERLVMIANHQIYTDWLYLWWIAYCNGMHGRLYIILKESLKQIPILGWGMQLSQFIFLKRNWEKDKPHMALALEKLNKLTKPMWLLLFPEGTNLAPSTREKSAAWAKKNGIADCKHVLLPRSTGLYFCIQQLKGTVDYIYDCTIAYEGVPRGQFAQDIFTLKAGYMEGRPPKSVSMHWRRFAIKDIPMQNEKIFDLWLTARWREKDILLEHYLRYGKFPSDIGATKYKSGRILRGCGHLEVPIRASHWYEFLQIFAPMGILAMVIYSFYGGLPQKFWNTINKEALRANTEEMRKAGQKVKSLPSNVSSFSLDSIFDKDKQQQSFQQGAMAVQKFLQTPTAQTLLKNADFIQKLVENPQKAVSDTVTGKQQDFKRAIEQEEARRRRKLPPPTNNKPMLPKPKGKFWEALEAEEKSRNGSVISAPSTTSRGSFWRDLKAAEDRRNGFNTAGPGKGNFWDALKMEENSRYGTVMTLSSSATTSHNTVRSVPSTAASSRTKSTTSNPIKPKPIQQPQKTTSVKSAPQKLASRPKPITSTTPNINKPVSGPAKPGSKPSVAPITTPKPKPPSSVPPKLASSTTKKPPIKPVSNTVQKATKTPLKAPAMKTPVAAAKKPTSTPVSKPSNPKPAVKPVAKPSNKPAVLAKSSTTAKK